LDVCCFLGLKKLALFILEPKTRRTDMADDPLFWMLVASPILQMGAFAFHVITLRRDKRLAAKRETPLLPPHLTHNPEDDEWAYRMLRLVDLAFLGYSQAIQVMSGELVPLVRAMMTSCRDPSREKEWSAIKCAIADMWSDRPSEDDEDDDADQVLVINWRKVLPCFRPLKELDQEDRRAFFYGLDEYTPHLLRILNGDRSALGFSSREEFVNYMRWLGMPDEKIVQELKHPSWTQERPSVEKLLTLGEVRGCLEEGVRDLEQQLLFQLNIAESALREVPKDRRSEIEGRIAGLRSKLTMERARKAEATAREAAANAESLVETMEDVGLLTRSISPEKSSS
jgi:hypothetical protein